ncbi:ABC transporter substrate-binding protein [Lysinibacillus sp. MHQ-1]|nr:ABC transporter substrate-binding protein [Lysinibacillus sp. MHQ-1]
MIQSQLRKNPDYYIDGYPKLDKVIYRSIPENSARLNDLLAGNIDVADGISPSDKGTIEGGC